MSKDELRALRLSRRGVIGGVVGSAAAAILAACGGSAPADTPTAAATKAPATVGTAGGAATTAPTTAPTVATSGSAAAATRPATTGSATAGTTGTTAASAPAMATAASTTASSTTASSPSAASGSAASGTMAASSGPAGMAPLPDMSKFKGQTLQMLSKTEYFKGTEQALDMVLQDLATKSGIKIENNRLNEDMDPVVQKIDAQIKSGDPPDLLYLDTFLPQFVQLGDLMDLTDLTSQAQDIYGPVEDGSVINMKIGGKYFGLPYFANAGGFFIRKDWLAEKGIKLSDVKTYDNLRDVALQISDPSKNRYGWGLTANSGGDGITTVNNILYAWGGAIVSDDGTKVVLNSPETLAAVNWLADLYTNPKYKPMLPPGVNSWTDPSNNEAWLAGTIGITNNAYTLYAQSFNTKNPVYDQTAISAGFLGPAIDQVVNAPGTGYLLIPKGAKNPDLAKAVALYLIGGPAFLAMAKPSLGLIMPTYKKLWAQDPFYMTGDPSFPALQQVIQAKLPLVTKTGYHFPQTPSPIYALAINGQHVTNVMMQQIIQKGQKPQDAIKDATDQLVAAANQLGLKQ